jgi:hypothetical protein
VCMPVCSVQRAVCSVQCACRCAERTLSQSSASTTRLL